MLRVKQILGTKGHEVWYVSPDTPVFDALTILAEKNIGALLVVEDKQVVGIMSERDYARKVALKGKTAADTPVSEIMTEKVMYVSSQQTTDECMALMSEKRCRHLPVIDDGNLVGLISIGDVVKAIISQHEFNIEQLENYIRGY